MHILVQPVVSSSWSENDDPFLTELQLIIIGSFERSVKFVVLKSVEGRESICQGDDM